MKLFLDSSVLLSASGSAKGASRHIVLARTDLGVELLSSAYCLSETVKNLGKLREDAERIFRDQISPRIDWVSDVVSSDKILVFTKSKDRPVITTALASEADFLLTLDRKDFQGQLGNRIYNMSIRTPGQWLLEMKAQHQ